MAAGSTRWASGRVGGTRHHTERSSLWELPVRAMPCHASVLGKEELCWKCSGLVSCSLCPAVGAAGSARPNVTDGCYRLLCHGTEPQLSAGTLPEALHPELTQEPRVAIGTINSFASDCCVNAGTCICFPFPLRLEAIDEHRCRGGTSRATQPPLALQGFGALGLTLSPQDSPAPPTPPDGTAGLRRRATPAVHGAR